MDRRTFLFIAISVLIIFAYQELVLKRLPAPTKSVPEGGPPGVQQGPITRNRPASPEATGVAPAGDLPALAQPPGSQRPSSRAEVAAPLEGRRVTVDTELYTAVLTTIGGRLESLTLKRYRESIDPDSPPLELVVSGPEHELPMGLELRGARVWSDAETVYTTESSNVRLADGQESTIELRGAIGQGVIRKRITFRDAEYAIELVVETPQLGELPVELTQPGPDGQPPSVALLWAKGLLPPDSQSRTPVGPAALISGKLVHTDVKTLEGQPKVLQGEITWAGYEDHYFLSAVAPAQSGELALRPRGSTLETKLITPRARDSGPLHYTLYLGPKDLDSLQQAGHGFARSLNLGWFGAISTLLLRVLNASHWLTHNYGLDIIVLTLLVKVAFWPLTQKSFQSMREMQKLQPQMTKIREKFKDDAKKMNQEMMELYRRHKVNPLGGCLPMVLQIPVFFGLYQALASAIELRHAPFALWVRDLSAPERLELLGFGVPVLTILLGVTMFVQQRMTPPAGDPTQQKIMMFMPVMFTFMFVGFPAGLTVYWLTNNVLTIAQQYAIMRTVPK